MLSAAFAMFVWGCLSVLYSRWNCPSIADTLTMCLSREGCLSMSGFSRAFRTNGATAFTRCTSRSSTDGTSAAERRDAGRGAEVEHVEREPVAPLAQIRLACIAPGGGAGKARGGDHARTGAKEHDRGLVADLHARAGRERDSTGDVGRLMSLRPVQVGARRAHRVVEEVDAIEGDLAHVTLARLVQLLVARLPGRGRGGRARERRRVDGGATEDARPGALEDRGVVASPVVAFAPPEGARDRPLRELVGPGDLPGGRNEPASQDLVDGREARGIERDGFQELDAAAEVGGPVRPGFLQGAAK